MRLWGFVAAAALVGFVALSWGQSAQQKAAAAREREHNDWANLGRYREANAALPLPAGGLQRVVFMGDSITDFWGHAPGSVFFPGKPYVNRGISGQTTPQMLVRFWPDVVALQPAVVVILAGTNDIAGNTGPMTLQDSERNLMAMAAIARQNRIRVVLASVLPAAAFPWKPGVQPAPIVGELNTWMKGYAADEKLVYLDYYSAMADAQGGMKQGLSSDGVHPTAAGYQVMAPLAEQAIAQALR